MQLQCLHICPQISFQLFSDDVLQTQKIFLYFLLFHSSCQYIYCYSNKKTSWYAHFHRILYTFSYSKAKRLNEKTKKQKVTFISNAFDMETDISHIYAILPQPFLYLFIPFAFRCWNSNILVYFPRFLNSRYYALLGQYIYRYSNKKLS